MVLVALPPVVNPTSSLLTRGLVHENHGLQRQRRWGEAPGHKGPTDPTSRFWDNVCLSHGVPVRVKSTDVERFMMSKALQSDVGSLMRITHNTKRRVPRHPTPAVFPRNEPSRKDSQGSFILSQTTRDSLEKCNKTLYVTPWASKTLPDFRSEIRRTSRMEQQKMKLLQKRAELAREAINGEFPYTTTYMDSYTKKSLAADQSKVYLPPIKRKISYANTTDEEETDGEEEEEEQCKEDIGAWPVPEDPGYDVGDRVTEKQHHFCDSLIDIRGRLRSEGWALPNIYTRRHPSYLDDLGDYMKGLGREQTANSTQNMTPTTECQDQIRSCSTSLVPQPCHDSGSCTPNSQQRIKLHTPNVAQTRIKYDSRLPIATLSEKEEETGLKSRRRVTFDSNPEVHNVAEFPRQDFSMRQPFQERDKDEEKRDEEDAEWGTDEELEAGYRRQTHLPSLQNPDFKTLCHSRHYLLHMEQVPDLRDFTTYSKKVFFDGTNSSAFRG